MSKKAARIGQIRNAYLSFNKIAALLIFVISS
jgi:hypothetical protein